MSSEIIMHLLTARCNNALRNESNIASNYIKFYIDQHFVGLIHRNFQEHLLKYDTVFVSTTGETLDKQEILTLHSRLQTPLQRTKAVEDVLKNLRHCADLVSLKGWRDEHYGVFIRGRSEALMSIERAGARILGTVRHGVHINVFTYIPEASLISTSNSSLLRAYDEVGNELKLSNVPPNLRMWVAVRSLTKINWPGLMDNMVAGGLTYPMTAFKCAQKEALEEAGIPDEISSQIKPCGSLSYAYDDELGMGAGVILNFDLELPQDFQPVAVDKEVAEFHLVSLHDLAKLIQTERFKANSAMVVLDYFIRHGFVDPDENPQLQQWCELMHLKLPFD